MLLGYQNMVGSYLQFKHTAGRLLSKPTHTNNSSIIIVMGHSRSNSLSVMSEKTTHTPAILGVFSFLLLLHSEKSYVNC